MANKTIDKNKINKESGNVKTARDKGVSSTDLLNYLSISTKLPCFFVKFCCCLFRFFHKTATAFKNHYCPSWEFYFGGTSKEFIITLRSGAKWVCDLNWNIAIVERNNIETETLIRELANNLGSQQAIWAFEFKGANRLPFTSLATLCDAGFRLRVDKFKIAAYRKRSNSNVEPFYTPIEK